MDISLIKLYLRDPYRHGRIVLQDMEGPVDINGSISIIAKRRDLEDNLSEEEVAKIIADEGKDFFAFYEYNEKTDSRPANIRYATLDYPFSDFRLAKGK